MKFWKCNSYRISISRLVNWFGDMTIPSSSSDYFLLLYLCQNWALSQNKTIVITNYCLRYTQNSQSESVSHSLLLKDFEITRNWESSYQMLPERYMASLHSQMKILCRLSKWKILVSTWPLENCLSVIHPDWSKNR